MRKLTSSLFLLALLFVALFSAQLGATPAQAAKSCKDAGKIGAGFRESSCPRIYLTGTNASKAFFIYTSTVKVNGKVYGAINNAPGSFYFYANEKGGTNPAIIFNRVIQGRHAGYFTLYIVIGPKTKAGTHTFAFKVDRVGATDFGAVLNTVTIEVDSAHHCEITGVKITSVSALRTADHNL